MSLCDFAANTEPCSNKGAVKLVRGNGAEEGTVQLCIAGVWGTVCDDYWGTNDAKVICRQLGLGGNGNTAIIIAPMQPYHFILSDV